MGRGALRVVRLGLVEYARAQYIMERVAEGIVRSRGTGRAGGTLEDTLLVLQHRPVYTLGKRGKESDLGEDGRARLRAETGAEVVDAPRGGQVTFHGPGQSVLYPIVDLRKKIAVGGPGSGCTQTLGARAYVETLEDVMIEAASASGLKGVEGRRAGAPGVYVGGRKLGAVGVKISHGVSTHGAAINVTTDLRYFETIVPCGLEGVSTTSIAAELGDDARVCINDVEDALVSSLVRLLRYDEIRELRSGPDEFL